MMKRNIQISSQVLANTSHGIINKSTRMVGNPFQALDRFINNAKVKVLPDASRWRLALVNPKESQHEFQQ
jgi:hypothetical protein